LTLCDEVAGRSQHDNGVLTPRAEVLEMIRRLRATNHAVILISHRMPDVFAVCDRVAVLRRGRKVADKPIAEITPEDVTGLITGAIERLD
jgi:simple sugar transport system ATP-binding protein